MLVLVFKEILLCTFLREALCRGNKRPPVGLGLTVWEAGGSSDGDGEV